MTRTLLVGIALASILAVASCVDEGPGADFDRDGLPDLSEDTDGNFEYNPPETDFNDADTDVDGLCDGLPDRDLAICTRCEDCNNDGFFEPCLNETDPLNDDTDNDGVRDAQDPNPAQGFDCSGGGPRLRYGASLPPGKPFPSRRSRTPTPARTATPQA